MEKCLQMRFTGEASPEGWMMHNFPFAFGRAADSVGTNKYNLKLFYVRIHGPPAPTHLQAASYETA